MSSSEHIEILRQGPRVWNAWRAENPSVVPSLNGISLSISDRQMGPINGGPINLSHASLCDATLYFATLSGADLRGADLTNADLRGARLEGVDLTGAELLGAQLDNADFAQASLKATNLCGASLADARNLTAEQIEEAEGDADTVLPPDLERPFVWTVGAGVQRLPGQAPAPLAPEKTDEDRPSPMGGGGFITAEAQPSPASFEPQPQREEISQPVEAKPAPPKPARPMLEKLGFKKQKIDKPARDEPARDKPAVEKPQQEHASAQPRKFVVPGTIPSANGMPDRQRSFASPASPTRTGAPEPLSPRPSPAPIETPPANADDGEDRHITWLVGGPRRVGR